ncbi:sex-regulated protein janus-A-like isoform X3 [Varroa jacobsoni]|uniref:Sex-regulated protein janus-A n=1 Tax=Varroa destructor TaxID=109461 RepID=A0A7M7KYW6_VARDE|nr:sex-regulated protein janus-A-like isoform X2 [Varroa destructor]XP_022696116.1 sex-regulated protein janus-A-like isoform X3 [Varroa jacobsoni]
MSEVSISRISEIMDKVPSCRLDTGRNRYVLIKIYVDNDEEKGRYIIRGSSLAPDHKTIFEGEEETLKKQNIDCDCCGGGYIVLSSEDKEIRVFGVSQYFGMADHEKAVAILSKQYAGHSISASNEVTDQKINRNSIRTEASKI